MRVTVTITRYEVSQWPTGHADYDWSKSVFVEWVGVPWQLTLASADPALAAAYTTMWRVRRAGHYAMNQAGKFNLEPQPSSRSVEWCREHSFTLDEALKQATKWVEDHS